mmetsp:Transcript_15175/g.39062  ORF Transcript_15175/g.39062 Transcript_15175/m.39062 type:complete len:254 (+) Transcript_15175:40-801(+)
MQFGLLLLGYWDPASCAQRSGAIREEAVSGLLHLLLHENQHVSGQHHSATAVSLHRAHDALGGARGPDLHALHDLAPHLLGHALLEVLHQPRGLGARVAEPLARVLEHVALRTPQRLVDIPVGHRLALQVLLLQELHAGLLRQQGDLHVALEAAVGRAEEMHRHATRSCARHRGGDVAADRAAQVVRPIADLDGDERALGPARLQSLAAAAAEERREAGLPRRPRQLHRLGVPDVRPVRTGEQRRHAMELPML